MQTERKRNYYRDYYRITDGRYASYWAGKFTNALMTEGRKRTIEREMEKMYIHAKLQHQLVPLEVLLESLEKVKPLFNLGFVIVSGKKREYPVYLAPHKQYRLSIQWLKKLITVRKEWYLSQRILAELTGIRTLRRHQLTKRRDELFATAVDNRFNVRYVY